ncbi:DUF624 domain-containing protein [uncultured Lactobacillus sp.]|uniref:DUF624 domain-containing protein n=1 Tax=uncultured Lactobacillus sp. TaxID=153152 RepID=UPI002639D042|nr:DUF624 domain-containing protein [uncultured Lactobacillus sp.]
MNKNHRNLIYVGIQIAWRVILGNIFFLSSNIFLILLSWNLKFKIITLPLYVLCSVTLFPSLVALFNYLRNSRVEDKVILGMKTYFKYFKEVFKVGCLESLIYEAVFWFLCIDIISANKFMKNGQLFLPLLTLLIVLTLVHLFWTVMLK